MPRRNHTERRHSVSDSKFYLPAGVRPSGETSLLKRLRATLFDHRV